MWMAALTPFPSDAVHFLRLPVHGTFDDISTTVAGPMVRTIIIYLLVHGVIDGDVIPSRRSLRVQHVASIDCMHDGLEFRPVILSAFQVSLEKQMSMNHFVQ